MFRKIVDVLKEVFWIKLSRKPRKSPAAKKKITRKFSKKAKPRKLPISKKSAVTPRKSIDASLTEIGVITHYFERIKVAVVKITKGTVLIGDKLTILGDKTKFVQKVWSMQVESEDVKIAKKGQMIGIKVDKAVAVGDKVFK